ncbi:hypothetical protein EST38_g14376 [Candolleomyces aberdarensis]|uniref:Uncharacterized protein n=1 Tax=Candolleomyces aberdarensis TaxID=2316362 RepID=A0A4Q2CYF9_9AGAR|nr:hypothetical protein EST38_g14376 [Candolleomyces aberdarensis]
MTTPSPSPIILEMNHHRDRVEVRDRQVQYGEALVNLVRDTVADMLAGTDAVGVSGPPAYSLVDPFSSQNRQLEDELEALEAEVALPYAEPAPEIAELEDRLPENDQVPATANGDLEDQPAPANDNKVPINEIPVVPVNETPVINEAPNEAPLPQALPPPPHALPQASPAVLPADETLAFSHVAVTLQRKPRAGRRQARGSGRPGETRQFLGPTLDASDTDTSTSSQILRVPRVIHFPEVPPTRVTNLTERSGVTDRMANALLRGLGLRTPAPSRPPPDWTIEDATLVEPLRPTRRPAAPYRREKSRPTTTPASTSGTSSESTSSSSSSVPTIPPNNSSSESEETCPNPSPYQPPLTVATASPSVASMRPPRPLDPSQASGEAALRQQLELLNKQARQLQEVVAQLLATHI